jgi:hypothetical protein
MDGPEETAKKMAEMDSKGLEAPYIDPIDVPGLKALASNPLRILAAKAANKAMVDKEELPPTKVASAKEVVPAKSWTEVAKERKDKQDAEMGKMSGMSVFDEAREQAKKMTNDNRKMDRESAVLEYLRKKRGQI